MQQGVMVQDLPSHVLCDLESSFNELDSYIAIVLAVQCHQDVGLVGVRPANLLIARMPVQGIVAVLQSWRAGSSGQPARPASICCALVAADCFAELLEVWVGVLLDVPLPVFLLQPAGVIVCSAVELRHDNIAIRTACERFSWWCAVLAALNAVWARSGGNLDFGSFTTGAASKDLLVPVGSVTRALLHYKCINNHETIRRTGTISLPSARSSWWHSWLDSQCLTFMNPSSASPEAHREDC